MKTLVTYFSCSGVTKEVAKKLAKVAKADLFEIKPAVPYTTQDLNWLDSNSRSSLEMKNPTSRPEISSKIDNMDDYDRVFVGFPIWWYIAPTIINSFLEGYDFSGKTVIPFCTSGGSPVGKTDESLHGSCSKETKWKPAKLLNHASDKVLDDWLKSLD